MMLMEDGSITIMKWGKNRFEPFAQNIAPQKIHYVMSQLQEKESNLQGYKKAIGEN
jgi:NAD-dependent SIR2 family protein deacetylase